MRYGKIDEMDVCKISNKKSAFKNTVFKFSSFKCPFIYIRQLIYLWTPKMNMKL